MKIRTAVFLLFLCVMHPVFADFMCDDTTTNYYAMYEIDSYTCNSGQYLPANTLGCVSCPNGFTCTGGTFVFNPDEYQGLELGTITSNTMNNICAANFPNNLTAIYQPNQHTCTQGYYLPMGVDGCRVCLNDHYCPGGTYTYNETTNQGITACPSDHPYAPAGMWQSSQCGRKLHIGNEEMYLRSTKLTTPSLNIAYGDQVFYANATTTPTPITRGSTHYLKVIYNDVEYYICDDTVLEIQE